MPLTDKTLYKKYMKEYMKSRARQRKEDLVAYKGGECERCGYSNCVAALHFHHLDPMTKKFALGTFNRTWEELKEEADKCVLLCANCHAEEHWQQKNGPIAPMVRAADSYPAGSRFES